MKIPLLPSRTAAATALLFAISGAGAVFAIARTGDTAASEHKQGLRLMLCTQEGAAKGLKGKELEAFVDRCLKAGQDAGGKGDALPPPEAVNC